MENHARWMLLRTAIFGDGTLEARFAERSHILIGVTSPQTCLILPDRVRALREAGFRVSLLSSPGEFLSETARQQGAEWHAISMRRGFSLFTDCVALIRIWCLIHRLKPDIVEFSTPKAGLLGSIAARLCRVPVRIYLLRGLKLETASGLKRRLLVWAERITGRCAHVVVCNSRSLEEQAVALRLAPEDKLLVLGEGSSNGVDLVRFSPVAMGAREQFGIPQEARVIGFVGRLTADKGLPELIEAFAVLLRRMPDIYLLLVGWFDAAEDAVERRLRERIESHPQIICTGFVKDTAPYYCAMDVMVLPSWREGFPNVLLEAAASGIPVVATSCTGSRDAVVSGVTGLLVAPGDTDAIGAAVARLLGDPEQSLRMSKAAREWVTNSYEMEDVLGRTVAFYRSLITPAEERMVAKAELAGESATGLSALP
jgi:glycosyltransferase involved in cell wall biosynthesis